MNSLVLEGEESEFKQEQKVWLKCFVFISDMFMFIQEEKLQSHVVYISQSVQGISAWIWTINAFLLNVYVLWSNPLNWCNLNSASWNMQISLRS